MAPTASREGNEVEDRVITRILWTHESLLAVAPGSQKLFQLRGPAPVVAVAPKIEPALRLKGSIPEPDP